MEKEIEMELLLIASPKLSSQRSFHVTKIYGAMPINSWVLRLYNKAEAKEASYPFLFAIEYLLDLTFIRAQNKVLLCVIEIPDPSTRPPVIIQWVWQTRGKDNR